jgi:hypothetical protein
MADLLFLPVTKGFKYLFVIVDLASDEFDIEPIKDKTPSTVLSAMQKCFKRKYINKPKGSVSTDSGSEFKSVFHKWLHDNNILHKTGLPSRHKQSANVENLNKTLGRLIIGYLNAFEKKTGKVYQDWLPAVPIIREMLNKERKKKLPDKPNEVPYSQFEGLTSKTIEQKVIVGKGKKKETIVKEVVVPVIKSKPKFKIGDSVFYKSPIPLDINGNKQPTTQFREGDRRYSKHAHDVTQILYFANPTQYRYILKGLPQVSFVETELKLE